MNYNFTEKTVLITGATRGIGKSIADSLINCGANLILTGTKQNEIIDLNKTYINNSKINYFHLDFLDDQSKKVFYQNISKVDKIDICINNAGINYVEDFIKSSKFDQISKVNVQGPYELLKIIGPKMIQNKYGRVINIASIWSVSTKRGRSLYTMSKNALVGLTKTLSIEWASHNILVNAISPGFTLTELTKKTNSLKELDEIKKSIPIGRLATPDEIANLAVYLISDNNTYLTGQNIVIDGGFTNR
jgi:3-oxoacyl-[acyl-carrier protein] reductase